MCGNNRSAGIFKDIVECLIRGVRDIDDHSEAVHFCDYFPTERAQSVPTLSLRGGVRYFIVTVMGQGYVPYPKLMKTLSKGSDFWIGAPFSIPMNMEMSPLALFLKASSGENAREAIPELASTAS